MHLFILLTACCCFVGADHLDSCEAEIAREHAEDARLHGCRACKQLEIDTTVNCPPVNYDCDPALRTTTNVLRVGTECAQLRCLDATATLFVEGKTVGKLRCTNSAWISATGVAASGVCARKCGLGICTPKPDAFFVDNPTFELIQVRPPDASHRCAWGSCPNGAQGSYATVTTDYDGLVVFSCSGDRTWRGPEGQRHDTVVCKKECKPRCTADMTDVTPTEGGAKTMTTDKIVECEKRILTCKGATLGQIKTYTGSPPTTHTYESDPTDPTAVTYTLACNAAGTGWEDPIRPGVAITAAQCLRN